MNLPHKPWTLRDQTATYQLHDWTIQGYQGSELIGFGRTLGFRVEISWLQLVRFP